MSFTPFGGFPTTLATIPHFAVGKFQQAQDHQGFVSIPSSQGLQIAVSTVDPSQLNHNLNGHVHVPTSSTLQIQNQMLNTLLSKTGQNDVFVKVETEGEVDDRFQHQHQHEKNSAQQDITSLNEYLSRFSGPPTFPFQQMYKYPTELIQITSQSEEQQQQQQQQQNMMNDNSPSVHTPEQQQQPQVITISHRLSLMGGNIQFIEFRHRKKLRRKRKDVIPSLACRHLVEGALVCNLPCLQLWMERRSMDVHSATPSSITARLSRHTLQSIDPRGRSSVTIAELPLSAKNTSTG